MRRDSVVGVLHQAYLPYTAVAGPSDPVLCFSFYRDQVLSATAANRIGVHSSVSENVRSSAVCGHCVGVYFRLLSQWCYRNSQALPGLDEILCV